MYLNLWHFWSYLISPVYFPISHDGNFSGHIDAEFFELLEVANLTIINVYKFTLDMPAWTVTKEGLNDSRLWSSLLKRKKKKKINLFPEAFFWMPVIQRWGGWAETVDPSSSHPALFQLSWKTFLESDFLVSWGKNISHAPRVFLECYADTTLR